jgi:Arc/MetJ-type ribon-helix-helix transcriptional regulator
MRKPQISTRIPEAWHEKIQSICAESGKSQSEVMQEAIASYLGQIDPKAVASLSKRVAILERQYQKLVKLV